jgi:hypothetical protein
VCLDVVDQGVATGIWMEGAAGSPALQPSKIVIDGGSEAHIVTQAVADRLGWKYQKTGGVSIKTAAGANDPILGVVNGATIILNKRQRTEQKGATGLLRHSRCGRHV